MLSAPLSSGLCQPEDKPKQTSKYGQPPQKWRKWLLVGYVGGTQRIKECKCIWDIV